MSMILVFGITVAAFAAVVTGMAVGVLFGRRAISGSCGGLASSRDADGNLSCSLCSRSTEGCQELQDRIQKEGCRSPTDACKASELDVRESEVVASER